MGIIGKDLLGLIINLEERDDWQTLVSVLAIAQRIAEEEYDRRIESGLKDWKKNG